MCDHAHDLRIHRNHRDRLWQPLFSRFWGPQVCAPWVKQGLRLGGPFWALFGVFLQFFSARASGQNIVKHCAVIYNVFATFAWKKYFLQHAENCVNKCFSYRRCPQNTANTVSFAPKDVPKRSVFTWKHHLCDDFWLLQEWEKSCVIKFRWLQDANKASGRHSGQQQPLGHRRCAKPYNIMLVNITPKKYLACAR